MSGRAAAVVLLGSAALLGLMLSRIPAGAQGGATDAPPPAPGVPTVYDAGLHALTVTWTEPDGADPAITGYDLEYRHRDSPTWLSGPQDQTGTSATIAGLEPDKNYYVRVRAQSSAGEGDWSEAGEGTTALYVGTLTARDGVGYRGYRRTRVEPYGGPNSPGELVPRSLTYDGAEYRIITLAWCRCTRRGLDGTIHTTAMDLYLFFNAAPDEWVLRVEGDRWLLSDAERGNLGLLGLKAYWPHVSPDWESGGQYEVSLSRNPALSSGGRGVIRGPLTAEMRGVPGTHRGTSAFQFTLSFSEDVENRRDDIAGDVLTVVGGSITDVSQVHERSHREWRVTIQPGGAADVAITLGGDRDCDTSGAVCTEDGRRLSQTITKAVTGPRPPAITGESHVGLGENGNGFVARFGASDPDSSRLTWQSPSGVDGGAFRMDGSGNLWFLAPPDFEAPADADGDNVYEVTVRVSDGLQVATHDVTVAVTDRNERPRAEDDEARTLEDHPVSVDVLENDGDPDAGDALTLRVVSVSNGAAAVEGGRTVVYTPTRDYHGEGRLRYEITDSQGLTASAAAVIAVEPVNDPPEFPSPSASRAVSVSAGEGDGAGAPVRATDVDGDALTYRLYGAPEFAIEARSGQIRVAPGAVLSSAAPGGYVVTVEADDGQGGFATIEVTITPTAGPATPPLPPGAGGGGGGGGGPSGPRPSSVDFEWSVDGDVELASGHDSATGLWGDGATLLLLQNGSGADDAVYAHALASGERDEAAEFALAGTNRAPRGVWSDGITIWVSDSGRDRLFAYERGSGERAPELELELAGRNAEARGIWGGGGTIWVLDGGDDAIFAYDVESGELLAEYGLDPANAEPHGLWSDGTTVWVSNHDPKRLVAYRLPAAPGAPPAGGVEAVPLEREPALDFTRLSAAGNNSPRGIWSDGALMYVVDALDARVYSYNIPDAIDTRLASLSLDGVGIGAFDPHTTGYEGVPDDGVAEATVEAVAAQEGAAVAIAPGDVDPVAGGHQVALAGTDEIAVAVTSPDGSRSRTYRVRLPRAPEWPGCLRGDVAAGFSLVLYRGGSVPELVACAGGPRRHRALRARRRRVPRLHRGGARPGERGLRGALRRGRSRLHAAPRPERRPRLCGSAPRLGRDAGLGRVPAGRARGRPQPRGPRGREPHGAPRVRGGARGERPLRAPGGRVPRLHRGGAGARERGLRAALRWRRAGRDPAHREAGAAAPRGSGRRRRRRRLTGDRTAPPRQDRRLAQGGGGHRRCPEHPGDGGARHRRCHARRSDAPSPASGVPDADGLQDATFAERRLAGDAGISAATGSTYTPVTADQARAVKVRVAFTDGAGNAETVSGAAPAACPACGESDHVPLLAGDLGGFASVHAASERLTDCSLRMNHSD